MQRKNIGRTLGVIGLVLVLSSALTWIIGRPDLAVAKIVIGLALCGIYIATNFRDLGQKATSRSTFFVTVTAVSTLVVIALITTANYIAIKNPKTWDLTKNKINTLAPDTIKTLEGLKEDVTVTAFFSPGEQAYDYLDDMLGKYKARSAHLKYEFVDQRKDPVKVKQFNVRAEGPRIIVKLGNTESRVQEPSEEALTNAIVKVTHSSTKKVYFSSGHGESDPKDSGETGYSQVKKRMEDEGLKAESINFASTSEIPADAQAIVIAGPAKPFQPGEVEIVKKYLDAGGKAFIMVEPDIESGLDELLKAYGVQADKSLVIDPISRLFGASEAVPVVQNYSTTSEITRDFKLNTVFPSARPLTILKESEGDAASRPNAQPLALSMPSAWGETNPKGKVQRDENELGGPFPLVVTTTKDTKSVQNKRSDQARLIIAGDRDFASNKFRSAFGNEDFFLNSLSWLSDQTERITIRPRFRDASRLYLSQTQQASIFFSAIDALPVALLATGLAVWLVRRSK